MLIRRRLVLSNLLMFLVPFGVILTMAGGFYFAFQEYRLTEMGNMTRDKIAVHKVEREIRRQAELLRAAPDDMAFTGQVRSLAAALSELNYHLLLLDDAGTTVFSNCDELDIQSLGEENRPMVFAEDSCVFILRSSNIVKYMFERNGIQYHAVGILSHNLTEIERNLLYFYRGYMGILICAGVLILWLVNRLLARKLAQKINVPLTQLREGACQIKEGNLDFEIKCSGDEEFMQVGRDFNEMRERLKASEESRQKYEEDRNILLAGISHDIRTPLTVIRGYIEGLRDGVAVTPEMQQKYLQKVYERSEELDKLVDKLFLYSKLNMGQYPFSFQSVNLQQWLESFVIFIQEEFARRGITVQLDGAIPNVTLNLDCVEMQRVLMNLFVNARKYGSGKADLAVTVSARQDGDFIKICVADNGAGVADDELQKIFTGFYRSDAARSGAGGSGLGLAIAEKIVIAHGGRIWAENRQGLAVFIVLPLANLNNKEIMS